MTARPVTEPQTTSKARIRSPANRPSMRGFRTSLTNVPSNVPCPPTGKTPVGNPKAVSAPAKTRSLSCQSALVTWNSMLDRSPYAVRPCSSTNVSAVASVLGPMSTHSGP